MVLASRRRVACLALAAAVLIPAPAPAQYERQFGEPVDVRLDDLIQNPGEYAQRAVRTKGRLDISNQTGAGLAFVLKGSFQGSARIVAAGSAAAQWDSSARAWIGREIEVTGVVGQASSTRGAGATDSAVVITIWAFTGPDEEDDDKKPVEARASTLESLVTAPGRRDGETVRVVGKFRGRNLYGDLPVKSQKSTSDWVIKDDMFAIWITGKKPKGSGWELDPTLKRDTGKWIEVVGKPETRNGVTYVRATRVTLSGPPTPTSEAKAPPPPPERPKVPPVVVFALPLDGEAEVEATSRFVVQFSKDMDEATFAGRVQLRYAGPRLPGDREFDGLKVSYDGGRRALTVDPGNVLRRGRRLELILLPGIADTDGMPLVPRPPRGSGKETAATAGESGVPAIVDILRYQVGL